MRNSHDKIPTTRGKFLVRTGFILIAPATLLWSLLAALIVEPKDCPC